MVDFFFFNVKSNLKPSILVVWSLVTTQESRLAPLTFSLDVLSCMFIFLTLFVQATERRDAIAKFIYASLFDWLVEQVNKSLEVGKPHTGKSISILDIYGFQTFQVWNLY